MALQREFYICKGATKVSPKNLPVEFYIYSKGDTLCAQCFVGRAQKPTWHYRFKSEEQRTRRIKEQIEAVKAKEAAKAERKAKRGNHNLKVGDILVSSWGYEQTNIDFYVVTKLIGKSMVEFVPIPKTEVEGTTEEHGMACKVVPVKYYDTTNQPASRGRVNEYNSIKIASYSYASRWDGNPIYMSWYG